MHEVVAYRNEVERQVDEVPDDRRGSEFCKRLASQFAEPRNHISGATTLNLSFFCDKFGVATLNQRAIKRVDQAVFDKESLAQHHGEGARFA